MDLVSIILKAGNAIGHLVSAGLAVDAVNNAVHGKYQIAAFELVASAYIQANKYLNRRKQRSIQEFRDGVNETDQYAERIGADIESRFASLGKELEKLSG